MVFVNVYAFRMLSTERAFILVDTDIPCSKINSIDSSPSIFLRPLHWRPFTTETKKNFQFRFCLFPLCLPLPMSTVEPVVWKVLL